MLHGISGVVIALAAFVLTQPNAQEKEAGAIVKFDTAEKAWIVGAAFYNARDFESSREPFEAALELAPDDEFRLKVYGALLPAYREIPEFDPYLTASEFIISHGPKDARQSLTRRALLSFAYNRGQLKNLIKRYEERLSKDENDRMAVYILSEIYSSSDQNPKRAIELIQQLQKLDADKQKPGDKPADPYESAKIARQKANLAAQYMKAKEFEKSAKLYEEIAPLDPTTHAWNLKEAATAWLKDGKKDEALRVVLEADKAEPEARNDQLAHFYHRKLGDILLEVGEPAKAAEHFKIAIEKTKIEGYVKDTRASLQKAIEAQDIEE